MIEVKVKLDPRAVWKLEDTAEKRGMTLGEHIAEIVTPRVSKVHENGDRTRSEVARLHALGLADEEIAARVDRVQEHVARLRRAAGLKPNRKKLAAHVA